MAVVHGCQESVEPVAGRQFSLMEGIVSIDRAPTGEELSA